MRRWPRLLMAGMLVVMVGFYPLLASPPHRIDRAHFDRIVPGITQQQVESIFGAQPGEYDWAKPSVGAEHSLRIGLAAREMELAARELRAITETVKSGAQRREILQTRPSYSSTLRTWTSRQGIFVVSFDDKGRVVSSARSPLIHIVPPWQRWWDYWQK